ncbi:MAG: DUF2334 domain-containing protein [Candidatus Azambacteria bacterium]|nr:DUF2334 domain-containing protein [Candidatus Azambacteria bacterium]
MINYFFRLDDIAPNMNWDNFLKIKEIFNKYKIKPLIAIIPDNKDMELLKYPHNIDFWEVIGQLKESGWIISQHGYQHLYKTQNGGIMNINNQGEFSGLDFETQKRMINNGKYLMKTKICEPNIFVAPGHSFDQYTVEALKESNFKYISDGIALYPFKKLGIVWLPQILWRPRWWLFGMVTIALHLNTMTEENFNDLKKFIDNNAKKIGNFADLINWYSSAGALKRFLTGIVNLIFKPIWRVIFFLKHGLPGQK